MPTKGVGGREGLRGLGAELVRLDMRHQRDKLSRRSYQYSWLHSARDVVSVADSGLHDTLRPYNDPALLESHGEQLLDLFIRLTSKTQWKRWLDISASVAVSMAATDVLLRLFAAYDDPVDDGLLTTLLTVAAKGGIVEVLPALIAAGAGPKERCMSTTDIARREGLRGLGEELVRLDALDYRDGSRSRWGRQYSYSWSGVLANIVFVANCELHDALRPYDDPALLERHGEQLLDLAIRLSSKEQWNTCLDVSANIAASTGRRDILLRLFAARDGDSMDDRTLWRLLSIAAERGKTEIVSALIDAGAGPLVRAVDEVNWPITALHLAAKAGHRTFVTKLIEAGAPLESHHILGWTALTEAVQGGHKGVALDLLTAGADVNNIIDSRLPNSRGAACVYGEFTPLGVAVAGNDKDMVKLLLEAGADPAAGPTYELPLHMAASRGSFDIVNSLLLAGACVDSVDTEGRTALHVACSNSRDDTVDLLLRHNSSVASVCNNGISPMDAVGAQALALRQRGPPPKREINGLIQSYPSTLNSAETSTVDQICDMLQSASAWGRRGWLVVMRSRPLAEVVEQPTRSDADGGSLSVRDVHLVHEPSSNTAGVIREEGAVAQTLVDRRKASCDWSAAVAWLLQGPDESLFRNIVRFL